MEVTRQIRRAAILLALCATTAAVFRAHPQTSHGATVINASNTPSALALAEEARSAGRLREADSWLRTAWLVEPSRHVAARMLEDLHNARGFRLSVDEIALDATADLLGPGFRRYETSHFVILSDCEPGWTRAKASVLERTRQEFYKFAKRLGLPVIPHERKLLCVLINDYEQYRRFAREHDHLDASWIAGHYAIDANRIVFYNDLTGPAFSRALEELDRLDSQATQVASAANEAHTRNAALMLRQNASDARRQIDARRRDLADQASRFATAKTVHEAVHLLSFNSGLQVPSRAYPLWLSEGLASSFETDDPSRAFGPRFPSPAREETFRRLLREDRLVPWRDLIAMITPPAQDDERVEAVYAQSHVLFSYLARFERERLASYLLRLASDTHEPPRTPAQQAALFVQIFGPPERIAERLERF